MRFRNTITKILGPMPSSSSKERPVSLSHKLFTESGLVHFNRGVGTIMPLLLKSLRKLEVMVHKEMREISALEFMLPVLTPSNLFNISGRMNLPDLFKVPLDDNKYYILSPTCEEAITHVLSTYRVINVKNLPIRLYQINSKFRDEKRPRSGLLRAQEFLMKDLYCFDADEESSEQCYQDVIKQYHHFFSVLKVPYISAEGSTGNIGGLKSEEFHFISKAGQDKIILCNNCGHKENLEVAVHNKEGECRKCQSNNVSISNGIEVGHAFKLGTKFTEPFQMKFRNTNQAYELLHMSSFGLGLTRILAACVEVLSESDEIRWPIGLAPYLVCVLPPKAGSKEEAVASDTAQVIYDKLNQTFEDDIIMDDRTSLSLGKRLNSNKKLGFPFQVVLGKSLCDNPPTAEVVDTNTGSVNFIQIPDVNQFIIDKVQESYKSPNSRVKV